MSEREILPDCMMPDGAEPCKGYLQLQESAIQIAQEKQRLAAQVRSLQAEVDRLRKIAECNDPGAVGLSSGEYNPKAGGWS